MYLFSYMRTYINDKFLKSSMNDFQPVSRFKPAPVRYP